MPASLRDLLRIRRFALRLVAGADEGDPRLDEPLTWVHSSDLVDPTPWLDAGQLLLLDGINFAADADDAFCEAYVSRLAERGVRAVGFATEVVHAVVPPGLLRACERHRMPLVEVRDRTPFMGIIRYVADVISSDRQQRLEWSMSAQRAIARAALRPAGLGSIMAELERQLGCWVAVYDATGRRVRVPTRIAMPAELRDDVHEAVAAALARGNRSAARLSTPAGGVTLQTLGQRGTLRGVLAVGLTGAEAAEEALVDSVIALASIAFEQSHALDDAYRELRSGLLELILAGHLPVARAAATRSREALPAEPVRAIVVPQPPRGRALIDELELLVRDRRTRLFFAEREEDLVIVVHVNQTEGIAALLDRFGIAAGASAPAGWGALRAALNEARRAAAGPGLTHFDAGAGVTGLIPRDQAADASRRLLEPLLGHGEGRALLAEADAWLRHNGAWDPAARELNLHRHTLRAHINRVAEALGLDLDGFAGRTELWLALRAID